MIRRPLRPHFPPTDKPKLLAALGEARDWTLAYEHGQSYHDPVRLQCEAIVSSIDALAETLTGDRTHFHLKPHGGGFGQPQK